MSGGPSRSPPSWKGGGGSIRSGEGKRRRSRRRKLARGRLHLGEGGREGGREGERDEVGREEGRKMNDMYMYMYENMSTISLL